MVKPRQNKQLHIVSSITQNNTCIAYQRVLKYYIIGVTVVTAFWRYFCLVLCDSLPPTLKRIFYLKKKKMFLSFKKCLFLSQKSKKTNKNPNLILVKWFCHCHFPHHHERAYSSTSIGRKQTWLEVAFKGLMLRLVVVLHVNTNCSWSLGLCPHSCKTQQAQQCQQIGGAWTEMCGKQGVWCVKNVQQELGCLPFLCITVSFALQLSPGGVGCRGSPWVHLEGDVLDAWVYYMCITSTRARYPYGTFLLTL